MIKPTYRQLADALMDMVNQHCYVEQGIVHHGAIRANMDALDTLEALGLAEDIGKGKYRLNWAKLEEL